AVNALIYACVGVSAGLGLLTASVDILEARVQREAVEVAMRYVRGQDPAARPWFLSHWGFQYYATRADLRPAIPDESTLRPGDWLIRVSRVDVPLVRFPPEALDLVKVIELSDPLPLATLRDFYGGRVPVQRLSGPRLRVGVFHVLRDCVAETPLAPAAM